jgi:hypothetical protein
MLWEDAPWCEQEQALGTTAERPSLNQGGGNQAARWCLMQPTVRMELGGLWVCVRAAAADVSAVDLWLSTEERQAQKQDRGVHLFLTLVKRVLWAGRFSWVEVQRLYKVDEWPSKADKETARAAIFWWRLPMGWSQAGKWSLERALCRGVMCRRVAIYLCPRAIARARQAALSLVRVPATQRRVQI